MTDISVTAPAEVPTQGGLADLLFDRAERHPDGIMLSHQAGGGWQDATASEVRADVVAIAKGLVAAGIKPGDRVGLLSGNRYEWTLLDFAIWAAGAVSVPIYPSSSAEQIRMILADSGAVACVVDDDPHTTTVEGIRDTLPDLRYVWTFDSGAVATLVEVGRELDDSVIKERRAGVDAADPATIVYTSGTTGSPKGCVLTHANFLAEVDSVLHALSVLFEPGKDG
ncbi:AMP-binding protein, partial [Nocardiopsis gilva]